MRKRWLAALCIFCLCLSCLAPPATASDIVFVAVNDTIPSALNEAAMPFYSDGALYVPYTVFNNPALGVVPTYNVSEQTLTLADSSRQLLFSIADGTVREDSGSAKDRSLVIRYGILFVPVDYCAGFFGISVSYLTSAGGYSVVRLRTGMEVYSDSLFIEKAENLIQYRISEFLPSDPPPAPPTPETPPVTQAEPEPPVHPDVPDEPDEQEQEQERFCVALVGVSEPLLDWLDSRDLSVSFYLTPEEIAAQPDLIRRLLGSGGCLGVDAREAEDPKQSLQDVNRTLERMICTETVQVLLSEASDDDTCCALDAQCPGLLLLEPEDAPLTLIRLLAQKAELTFLRENTDLTLFSEAAETQE